MPDTVRQLVRNDLVTTLTNAALANYLEPHVSLFADEPGERTHGWPAFFVHAVDDRPVADEDNMIGFTTRRARFALECWDRVSDDAPPRASVADNVEVLLGRVIVALCVDPQRGDLALDTTIGNATFLLIVREQRLAGVELEVTCVYRHLFGQPFAPA